MPKEPTTFSDLYDLGMSYRTAHTIAAVLPNLPDGESIIDIVGTWDDDEIAELKRRETPIVRGTDLYRVWIHGDPAPVAVIEPIPHGFRSYEIHHDDFVEIVSVDASLYDFTDTDQAQLHAFGGRSPYFDTSHDDEDGPGVRKPRLPV